MFKHGRTRRAALASALCFKSCKAWAQAGKRDPSVRQVGDSCSPSLPKPKSNHTVRAL